MIYLGDIRQNQGEPFATYLQCWRSLYSRYPCQLPKRENIDIFVNTLVPELYYDLRKQLFSSFNDMVESAYCIEDVAIKKGDIVINKDIRGYGNGKDKNKSWNKNKYVVNYGVVEIPKAKELLPKIIVQFRQKSIKKNVNLFSLKQFMRISRVQ